MDTLQLKERPLQPRKAIRKTMVEMEIGDEASWSLIQMSSVRTVASQVGLELNRFYRSKTDRETRQIKVQRIQ